MSIYICSNFTPERTTNTIKSGGCWCLHCEKTDCLGTLSWNCTGHILGWSLDGDRQRGLFVSLHVYAQKWEVTKWLQMIMVGKWEFTGHTRVWPRRAAGIFTATLLAAGSVDGWPHRVECKVTRLCLCALRVPSGAWWLVWWWACVGWCWSLPSRLPDVALSTRPLQCCAASTISISPYCSAASLLSWLV